MVDDAGDLRVVDVARARGAHQLAGVDGELLDVLGDAVEAVLVLLEEVAGAAQRVVQAVERLGDLLLVLAQRGDARVQQLVALGQQHVEAGRVEPAGHGAVGDGRVRRGAGVDREELLAEHALRRHVEDRVVVDALLVAALDLRAHAHQRGARADRHRLAAAELDLGDGADLDARDLHGRSRLKPARVVEVDVDRRARLEVDAPHHDDERREEADRHEDEHPHLGFDRRLAHGFRLYPKWPAFLSIRFPWARWPGRG